MASQNIMLQPSANREKATAAYGSHPLYRLAIDTPEHLEPTLRRAALRMVRRRFSRWLREKCSVIMSQIEHSRRGAAHSA